MDLIDDDGRLFGVVNLVDALAVLFVLTVIVAGIAFVNPFASPEPATRYATIDLGEQPGYLAERIDEGDEMVLEDAPGNLTVTDVHVTPASGDRVNVVVRAQLRGRMVFDETRGRDVFEYDGDRLTQGRSLRIDTLEYVAEGTVVSVDETDPDLATSTRSVLVQATVSPETARTIERGDAFRVSGREVATVDSVTLLPGPGPDRHLVVLGLDLVTIDRGDGPQFAGRELRLETTVPFRTEEYALSSRITRVGTTTPNMGDSQVVVRTTVQTTTANSIGVGDEYRIGSTTVGTVESIQRYPTGDQTTERVVLGLTLRTLQRGGTVQFGTRELRLGTSIRFTTDTYSLSGQLIRRNGLSLPGEPRERTVQIKLANVPPELADSISAGMTETRGDTTIAEVLDVRVEPAEITLTSEDGNIFRREHPVNRDVYLTVRVRTRETPTGLQFHAQPLQSGNDIVLDLGSVTVRGTVVELRND